MRCRYFGLARKSDVSTIERYVASTTLRRGMSDLFGAPIVDKAYRDKLRISMRGAIDFARRRQEKRLRLGKSAAHVALTLDEAMNLLCEQDYRCALTRFRFYSLSGDSYGPSRPQHRSCAARGTLQSRQCARCLAGREQPARDRHRRRYVHDSKGARCERTASIGRWLEVPESTWGRPTGERV